MFSNLEYGKSRIVACCMVLWVALLSLASCLGENSEDISYSPGYFSGTHYDGKWDVDGVAGAKADVIAYPHYFYLDGLPYGAILDHVFPGSVIENVEGIDANNRLPFVAMTTSETSQLLSLQPPVWTINATVDGVGHVVHVSFMTVGSTDVISWGTLTKSGMLTVILRTTAYSVDNGGQHPLSLKITYNATKK